MMKPITLIGLIAVAVSAALLSGCPTELSSETSVTLFVFAANENDALETDHVATISGADITAELPYGTAVTGLSATAILADGASVAPDPSVAADYSEPVAFTVVAADGTTTATYTVTVRLADASPDPPGFGLSTFDFVATDNATRLSADVTGTVGDSTVSLSVPYATDRNGLKPAITIDGATVAPASGIAQDFRQQIVYTVIADDGRTKDYTVTVTMADPPSQVPVFKTGQTASYAAGDDGNLQAGRAWPSPRFTDNGDGTITDNMTGLTWQQDPDENTKNWEAALTYADGSTLAGYTDWRVPNVIEMASLFSYDVAWASPNTQADWLESVGFSTAVSHAQWWTSTTVAANTGNAYRTYIDSSNNATWIAAGLKTDNAVYRAIVVRGTSDVLPKTGAGPIGGYNLVTGEDGDLQMGVPWPSPRFTDNGDNTVIDNLTGLVWEQTVSTTATDLAGALSEVATFSDGGHEDWRLPNIRELMTLANFGEVEMADWLNSSGFSGVVGGSAPGDFPWSSTREPGSDPSVTGMAVTWGAGTFPLYNFGNGIGGSNAIAWPVRGGE